MATADLRVACKFSALSEKYMCAPTISLEWSSIIRIRKVRRFFPDPSGIYGK